MSSETLPGPRLAARTRAALLAGALLLAGLTSAWLLREPGVPREAALMAGILALAALLWVTEAVPLFTTSLIVIGLQIILLANPGGWPGLGFASGASPSYRKILESAADPVLLLFFGGFLLSQAAVKEGVDRVMAGALLRPFGPRPRQALLGLLAVTMMFSMWMSNTATAMMMMALAAPMIEACPERDRFRRALLLAVAFGANIGGIGTPIASPPNAMALGFLRKTGQSVAFGSWMLLAIPLMCVLALLAWLLLWKMFTPSRPGLRFIYCREKLTGRGWVVLGVFVLTALLWATDAWTGLPPAVVALAPAILLTAAGILSARDLGSIEWGILILVAGGISLGAGIQLTGLDQLLVRLLPVSQASGAALLAILVFATLVLGSFMSNTAAANLFLPIGMAAAQSGASSLSATQAALGIAFAASLSMTFPISTPPNAIAYARGELTVRDLALPALALSAAAALIIIFFSGFALRAAGLAP